MQTKVCRRCGTEKGLSEFGLDRSREDQLNQWCRTCVKEQAAINRSKRNSNIVYPAVILRVAILVDALAIKTDEHGYITVPGTIRSLIEAMELDYGILWIILKIYIRPAGRNRYRVVKPLDSLMIQKIYTAYLFDVEKKESNNPKIEFEPERKLPVSSAEMILLNITHRNRLIENMYHQTIKQYVHE